VSSEKERLLEKLRAPEGATSSLARLVVVHALDQRLDTFVTPERAAGLLRRSLRSWLASPGAIRRVEASLESWLSRLEETEEPVGSRLDPRVIERAKEWLGRPGSVDPEVVRTVVDREPVRQLIRSMLLDALVAFGMRMRSPIADNSLAKGLGGLGRRALDVAKSRSGTLGALTFGMVGALSDEVERHVTELAAEVADGAVAGAIDKIVDGLADGTRSKERAELARTLFDGALELTGVQLAQQLRRNDLPGSFAHLREAASAWLESETAEKTLTEALAVALEHDLARPVRDLLAEVGLLAEVEHELVSQTERSLRTLFVSDDFAQWWQAL